MRGITMSIILEEISTDALAYLGDSVIELLVREHLVNMNITSSGGLNSKSLEFVKAGAQAQAMRSILPLLTSEEEAIFKRGRNKAGGNVPKSATVSEYRAATGMETLFGYLHLKGDRERIVELFRIGYQIEQQLNNNRTTIEQQSNNN